MTVVDEGSAKRDGSGSERKPLAFLTPASQGIILRRKHHDWGQRALVSSIASWRVELAQQGAATLMLVCLRTYEAQVE